MKIKKSESPTIRFRRARFWAIIAAVTAAAVILEAAWVNGRCVKILRENADLTTQNAVLERQNQEFQAYINEVNLGGGERND